MIKEDIMAKKKKCKNKNKKSNTYDNNNSNFSNDYEMSEFDIKSLKLLQLQILIIFINIYANFILYISSLQGIELIYSKYNGNNDYEYKISPDKTALEGLYIFFTTQLVIANIAITKYNMLYERKQKGEISYSLEPNVNIVIANIINIISNVYLVTGAEGIYARENNQPIIGV